MALTRDVEREEQLRFERGPAILVGFLAVVATFVTVWNGYVAPTLGRTFGLPPGDPWRIVLVAVAGFVMLVVGWVVFRLEGVRLRDVGLSWDHARSGVLWVAGIVVGLNLLLVALTVAIGGTLELRSTGWTPLVIGAHLVVTWVFVGIAEELLGRAYLQNKLVALFGGGRDRLRKAGGIVVAALLFALWHVPQRLFVAGLDSGQLPTNVLVLVAVGLAFGLVYEYTRNVVFVGLLHGAYDFPPLLYNVHYEGGSPWIQLLLMVALFLPVVVGIYAYHRWARETRANDFRPQVIA